MCRRVRGVGSEVLLVGGRAGSLRWRAFLRCRRPLVLVGCGGDEGGAPTLTWYINPDNGGQAELAEQVRRRVRRRLHASRRRSCPTRPTSSASSSCGGSPPTTPSIDLMSLDPPFVAEFANAGYLLPITDPGRRRRRSPTACSTPRWRPRTGTTSWWPRRSGPTPSCCGTASRSPRRPASIPTAADFTWDADDRGRRVAGQADRRAGPPLRGLHGLDQRPHRLRRRADHRERRARRRRHADRGVAGRRHAPPTSSARWPARPRPPPTCRPPARRRPARCSRATTASFMVNWPYVYHAAQEAVDDGRPRPVGRRRHRLGPLPARSAAGTPSTPPLGGINLAIGTFTKHPDEALAAAKCITSLESNIEYMIESGNPAARAAAYDDPDGARGVPDGRPDPRVDQRRRAAAGHAVLRRRVGVGAAHLAPAGGACSAPEHARGDRRPTWPTCSAGTACCDHRPRRTTPAPTTEERHDHRRDPRPSLRPSRRRRPRRISPSGPATSAGSACTLSAPAFIVMILVTAYPLVYAVVLSLYKYRLTDPDGPGVRRAAATTSPCSPTRSGGTTS